MKLVIISAILIGSFFLLVEKTEEQDVLGIHNGERPPPLITTNFHSIPELDFTIYITPTVEPIQTIVDPPKLASAKTPEITAAGISQTILNDTELIQVIYAAGIPEYYHHKNGIIYDHQWWKDMVWCESRNNVLAVNSDTYFGLVQLLKSWMPRAGFLEEQWSDPLANLSAAWWLMQNADPRTQWPNCD